MTAPKPRGFNYVDALKIVRPELVHLYTGAPGRVVWPANLFDEPPEDEPVREDAEDSDE